MEVLKTKAETQTKHNRNNLHHASIYNVITKYSLISTFSFLETPHLQVKTTRVTIRAWPVGPTRRPAEKTWHGPGQ